MFIRLITLSLSLMSSSSLWAFTCYYTLAKDSCWTNYNVSVDVMDAVTDTVLTTVVVPSGKNWTRQAFDCQPGQKLMYKAIFSPIIWESEKGKVYPAKDYWSLPGEIKAGDSAWEVPVCYPANFSQVPLPPDATANCKCDFKSIPPLKPKQI